MNRIYGFIEADTKLKDVINGCRNGVMQYADCRRKYY